MGTYLRKKKKYLEGSLTLLLPNNLDAARVALVQIMEVAINEAEYSLSNLPTI